MRFPQDTLDTLKERADVLTIIGDHVQLRRAGSRYKGLCPFHDEKTPSFTVDPERGQWFCFGCSTGGDLIAFYEQLHGGGFVAAVEALADRTSTPLARIEDDGDPLDDQPRQSRRRLTAALADAADWYHQQLLSTVGAPVRNYLKQRGFDRAEADRWQLGYAPDANGLVTHLRDAGYSDDELLAANLAAASERNAQLYDRFRGRLVFPVRDHIGTVLGFGGRIVPGIDDDRESRPKYLNTSETELYRKSKLLYGLDQAVADVRRNGRAIIVEGYTDVIALQQLGIPTAVATCGTAITADHVRLLTRLGAARAILAFDGDAAGRKAVERAFAAAAGTDLDLRVLPLPTGADPADWAATVGAEQAVAAIDGAVPAARWLIRTGLAAHDLALPEGRRAAAKTAIATLALIEDPVTRTEYLTYATDEGLSTELLHKVAADAGVALTVTATHGAARSVAGPVATGEFRKVRTRLEADVLWVALHQPELLPELWWDAIADDFTHPKLAQLFQVLDSAGGVGVPFDDVLAAAGSDEERTLLRRLLLRDAPHGLDGIMADQAVRSLLVPRIDRQIEQLTAQLSETRDAYEGLLATIQQLTNRRRELTAGPQRRR